MSKGSSSRYWALVVDEPEDGVRPVSFPVCRKCAHDPLVRREAETSWGVWPVYPVPLEIVAHRRAERCSECDRPLLVEPTYTTPSMFGGNEYDYVEKDGN